MEFGVGHFCVGRTLRIVVELLGVVGCGVLGRRSLLESTVVRGEH